MDQLAKVNKYIKFQLEPELQHQNLVGVLLVRIFLCYLKNKYFRRGKILVFVGTPINTAVSITFTLIDSVFGCLNFTPVRGINNGLFPQTRVRIAVVKHRLSRVIRVLRSTSIQQGSWAHSLSSLHSSVVNLTWVATFPRKISTHFRVIVSHLIPKTATIVL